MDNGFHIPRKRFGQNFLTDSHIIDKIILGIQPKKNDNLVEIGPGLGALTKSLLPALDTLHVIEIDRDLVAQLQKLKFEYKTLTIHNNDALKFDYSTLAKIQPIRVIGNLPYNISTPLLFHLFSFSKNILDMHFMLQKEVVDRMIATPNSEHYGRLSIMVQYYADVHKLFGVKPGSFKPAPKVDSAVVRLQIKSPTIQAKDEQHFTCLVRQAFSQRRKKLRNNLKNTIEQKIIEDCNIDPNVRAETLTIDDFVKLSNASYTSS